MLWLNQKISNLVKTINPKDIAFLLASSLELNKAKKTSLKAELALECLSLHQNFKEYILEFYLKTSDKLRCIALNGMEKELKELYINRSVEDNSIVSKVFSNKKKYFTTAIEEEIGRRSELLTKLNIKSSLFLPITDIGLLIVNKKDTERFDVYDYLLLKRFIGEVVTPSLDLAFDNEKNFSASIKDPLTDLYNHGYFNLQLEREIENARRGKNDVSLIMIDIDYFKNYNDLNGHPNGDKVLINVANILKNNTREGDLAVRYGGEEFVIILVNTKLKDAAEKAEQIRKTILEYKFDREELQPDGDLTISVGVASFPKLADNMFELIEKADKALYKSKNTGKNKVTIYED